MDTEKRGNKHIICGAGSAHPVRRLLTAALAVCLLASGCTKAPGAGKGTGTETEKEKTAAVSGAESRAEEGKQGKKEQKEQEEQPDEYGFSRIGEKVNTTEYSDGDLPAVVTTTEAIFGRKSTGEVMISYSEFSVSDTDASRYPALTTALKKYSADNAARADAMRAELEELFLALPAEMGIPYLYHYEEPKLTRSDTKLFSGYRMLDDYSGGVHGMQVMSGFCYDTGTGRKVAFTDIIPEEKKAELCDAIASSIRSFANGEPIEPWQGIDAYLDHLKENETELDWSADPDGITIYFAPYELATYAEGILCAKLTAAEHPELFETSMELFETVRSEE